MLKGFKFFKCKFGGWFSFQPHSMPLQGANKKMVPLPDKFALV